MMERMEWKVDPRSYRCGGDEMMDGCQSSSNAAEASNQQAPTPTPHQGSCASPEYEALFVKWPFKAPSRGQTPMPPSVADLIHHLTTKEERMIAMQLWNRSLPVAANVGFIEYNRVDAARFRERVREKYGEGWWRRLDDLAMGLNEAAGVVLGKGRGAGVMKGKGKEVERMGPELKTVEELKGKGNESDVETSSGIGGTVKGVENRTLDHLADAAALVVKTVHRSQTETAKSSTGEDRETQLQTDADVAQAALGLLSLSETPADCAANDTKTLAASNALSAIWYLIDRFFSSGYEAASYFFVALEAAIRLDETTVHALNIPAPPAFWTDAADWKTPKVGMTLIFTLASSKRNKFDAFARFSRSFGEPALNVDEMRIKNSASLRKAVLRAKADAVNRQRTTILGVGLRDVFHSQLREVHGKDIEKHFATFARMFALGICPDGAKLWLVGGEWGETATICESNSKVGAAVGTWEEMDEFVRAFEGFAVPDGQWNRQRFKWYRRCFAVDLKQFDLQIEEEEKRKRGMQAKGEGVKRLLNEIEAWVEIYKIEDVKREDVGKFNWL